jgi:LysM repeat protein
VVDTKPAKVEPKAPTKTVAKAPEPAPKKVTPKTTPSSSGTKHTVRRGDNLTAIASRYRVSIDSIVKANRLKNKDQVILGQKLVSPSR